jgi:hypothetical protein
MKLARSLELLGESGHSPERAGEFRRGDVPWGAGKDATGIGRRPVPVLFNGYIEGQTISNYAGKVNS